MKRSIEPVNNKTFDSCITFLLPLEFRCIGLFSRLVKNGTPVFPEETGSLFVRLVARKCFSKQEHIEGIIFITSGGIVLHCIADDCEHEEWAVSLNQFLSKHQIHSIIGSKKDTEWLQKLSAAIPYRIVEYSLMIHEKPIHKKLSEVFFNSDDCELRRAEENETKAILPLQIGYDTEEVIAPGEKVNTKLCEANLIRILKKERIYLITHNKVPVAKAGTNAQGLFWDQIGGVYTVPELRGKGFATALVKKLVDEIHEKDKNAALFVKITNPAARKAYLKVGFRDILPFRISYF